MQKLFWFIGSTLGGMIGWWVGEPFGIMTAVILSAVGTGLGIYVGYKVIRDYL
jgi:hypothetical protein